MEKYRLQRRLLGPVYSAGQMKHYEAAIDKAIMDDTARMREVAGRDVDVDLWSNYFALGLRPRSYYCLPIMLIYLDCLSTATFSTSYGMISRGKDDGSVTSVHSEWRLLHWLGFLPGLQESIKLFKSMMPNFSRSTHAEELPPMFAVS